MSENNKSYRIRTNVDGNSTGSTINVQLNQDFDILEILSLKISREQIYKLHTAKYGCIAGRVLANNSFGIPNAKISVFIEAEDNDLLDPVFSALYPYTQTSDTNLDNKRYNLLPDEAVSNCHQPVGSFPSKRMVLDDENVIEVFDKYYKYTTTTNNSGDYMIFGVPTGVQRIHVDVDLSDIGMLSQKPRDLYYKGYTKTLFENASMFKNDTNLDNLAQIISKNESVDVSPFWGEEGEGDSIAITRRDIKIDYKFEPTCIFIGSLITDSQSNGFSKKCIPTERMGKMDTLTTGEGTIEMIRKKTDGSVEEFHIQGNQLIDGNGTWCYQIPMNLDYMGTDEYGNMVPTDNPELGIPTRTRVRFRVSLNDFESDYMNNHLTKLLVPNNPHSKDELDYVFGTNTMDTEDGSGSFRDMFWNDVYTVKSFIPRIQKGKYNRNRRFSGIKQVNVDGGRNPIPYNNIRINLSFQFTIQCAVLKILIKVVSLFNRAMIFISGLRYNCAGLFNIDMDEKMGRAACSMVGDGMCPDLEDWYFAPGCSTDKFLKRTLNILQNGDDDFQLGKDEYSIDSTNSDKTNTNICLTNNINYLMQCVEINLAKEYEVIQFDFYNDWINGMLYIPRWFANIKKKRSFFFGLWTRQARYQACSEDSFSHTRKYTQQCALSYGLENGYYTKVTTSNGCAKKNNKQKCHKGYGRKYAKVFGSNGGGVHTEQTLKGQNVYYFKPCEWNSAGKKVNFFATDIVLLGNLNECNQEGIPQAFKSLSSSTFRMPTNLAATNMDSEGYMYGQGTNGTVCTGSKNYGDVGLEQKKSTFENYDRWSTNETDYHTKRSELDDATEYAITEASGIDWGYVGPNQTRNGDVKANELSALFFPGGHFLGISCTESNTQVNIKSCVNLSRVCEAGVTFSQRKSLPYYVKGDGDDEGDEGEIRYAHLVPTGLIDADSISDENFRAIFATLNLNRLKTRYNTTLQKREYDFTYCHPVQFLGDLASKLNDKSYNNHGGKGFPDDENWEEDGIEEGKTTTAFMRGYEVPDTDYYRYRFGIVDSKDANGDFKGTTSKELKKHYLIEDGSTVSLPVYENSYYFYFGLKDGATAFDRFMTEYYAECPDIVNYNPALIVTATDRDYCIEHGGTLTVDMSSMTAPFTVALTDSYENIYYLHPGDAYTDIIASTDSKTGSEEIITEYTQMTISGLTDGTYILSVIDDKKTTLSYTATINVTTPEPVRNINYSLLCDFIKEVDFDYYQHKMRGDFDSNSGVYSLSIPDDKRITSVLVCNDEYYYYYKGGGSKDDEKFGSVIRGKAKIENFYDLSGNTLNPTDYKYAWKGNDTYGVYVIYTCTDENKKLMLATTFEISMPGDPDYYIGSAEDLRGKVLSKAGIDTTEASWYTKDVNGQALDNLSEVQMWTLKKGLLATGSVYAHDTEEIIAGLVNQASVTSTMTIYGEGEIDDGEVVEVNAMPCSESDNAANGYDLSIGNFVVPTQGVPEDIASYGIVNGINKPDYNMIFDGMEISNGSTTVSGSTSDGGSGESGDGGSTSGSTSGGTIIGVKKYTVSYNLTNCREDTYSKSYNAGSTVESVTFHPKGGYKIASVTRTCNGKQNYLLVGEGDVYSTPSIASISADYTYDIVCMKSISRVEPLISGTTEIEDEIILRQD